MFSVFGNVFKPHEQWLGPTKFAFLPVVLKQQVFSTFFQPSLFQLFSTLSFQHLRHLFSTSQASNIHRASLCKLLDSSSIFHASQTANCWNLSSSFHALCLEPANCSGFLSSPACNLGSLRDLASEPISLKSSAFPTRTISIAQASFLFSLANRPQNPSPQIPQRRATTSHLPFSPLRNHLISPENPSPLQIPQRPLFSLAKPSPISPLLHSCSLSSRPICSQNCRPDRAAQPHPLLLCLPHSCASLPSPSFSPSLQQIVTSPVPLSGQQDRSSTQPVRSSCCRLDFLLSFVAFVKLVENIMGSDMFFNIVILWVCDELEK